MKRRKLTTYFHTQTLCYCTNQKMTAHTFKSLWIWLPTKLPPGKLVAECEASAKDLQVSGSKGKPFSSCFFPAEIATFFPSLCWRDKQMVCVQNCKRNRLQNVYLRFIFLKSLPVTFMCQPHFSQI